MKPPHRLCAHRAIHTQKREDRSCSAAEAASVCRDHKTHIIGILVFIQGPQKGAIKIMKYNRPRIKQGSLQSTQWNV